MKLNLGCGRDIKEGWRNVDCVDLPGVSQVYRLKDFWPWGDNTFDEVYASHSLEHLPDRKVAIEELWRVCAPGARVVIKLPDYRHVIAVEDPTHKTLWSVNTIEYFTESHGYSYITPARFRILKKETNGEEIVWELEVVK